MDVQLLKQADIVLSKCGRPIAPQGTSAVCFYRGIPIQAIFPTAPTAASQTITREISGDTTFLLRARGGSDGPEWSGMSSLLRRPRRQGDAGAAAADARAGAQGDMAWSNFSGNSDNFRGVFGNIYFFRHGCQNTYKQFVQKSGALPTRTMRMPHLRSTQ